MAGLGQTIEALERRRRDGSGAAASADSGRLVDSVGFGANPGNLRMLSYTPPSLKAGAPLVVVLHGCTQTAASYVEGAGWLRLADQLGFAALCPEQKTANNQNRCFNWFKPEQVRRGSGEVASIQRMIECLVVARGLDPSRVFVAGLSAGGAMAAAMLAAYPETFAAGAIVAGLPYRAASSMPEAFACMFQAPTHTPEVWGDLVRNASDHQGPWPRISVWQGASDSTVVPQNARELISQWTDVHGLAARPDRAERIGRETRETWLGPDGCVLVEAHTISGMGHGTPYAAGSGVGAAAPYVLEAGVCSTSMIAENWGLGTARASHQPAAAEARPTAKVGPRRISTPQQPPRATAARGVIDVEKVISDALRSAGLIRP